MDADTGGVGGDSGGSDWIDYDCAAPGGGDVAGDGGATGVCGKYHAKYGAIFPEMEKTIRENVSILSVVFVVIRGVTTSWVCDYYER